MGVCLKNVRMEVITDEAQAGPGFASLSDLFSSTDNSKERERVRRGIAEKKVTAKRVIRTTKDLETGPILINVEEANAWLQSSRYMDERPQRIDRPEVASHEHSLPDSVKCLEVADRIATALERIVAAVEAMATEPARSSIAVFDVPQD
jgi:hypothetical protein